MTDVIVTLVASVLTVGPVLLWVFLSKQTRVPRTRRTAVGIPLRTLPLFLTLFFVCRGLGVDVLVAVMVLALVLWACLTNPLGTPIGVFGILYVIQQWILGWPDRADSVLKPSSPCRDGISHLDDFVGKTAITSSALRPAGTVILDGNEYPASSELGYIDCGKSVRVIAKRGTTFIVRAVDEVSCPTRDATL